jgi:hypothetical protein
MSQYTLVVADTTGIQDYIFGTNQLKQNVGASYLVDCATRKWAVESLPNEHNVKDLDNPLDPFTSETIENSELAAEVIYAGGGNTMIVFASRSEAVAFTQLLTSKVLLDAPGLHLVLAHENFDWQQKALGGEYGVVSSIMKKLALKKAGQLVSSPMLGLGVTASCAFTGMPAVSYQLEGSNRLIAAEAQAKLDAEPQAIQRLMDLFNFGDYEPAKDFDDFGRTFGESSYISLIHTDGNGMASRIQKIRDKLSSPSQNRDYIKEMRDFSISIQQAAQESLQSTIDKLIHTIHRENCDFVIGKKNEIILQDNKLPFRPIVFGGDDVTFVCDGRLGLSLAAYYLQQFSSHRLSDKAHAYCRAGIAVVKTHYPFSRAYDVADELCVSAKEYIAARKQPPYNEDGLTAMDWHFAVGGLVREINDVRQREYTIPKEGSLLIRPVRLTALEKDWRSWDAFTKIIKEFQADDGPWAGRRNKINALRDALRTNRNAVKHFLKVYNLHELPKISGQPDMAIQGWQGDRCGYFDAIEAIDFFIALEGDGQ